MNTRDYSIVRLGRRRQEIIDRIMAAEDDLATDDDLARELALWRRVGRIENRMAGWIALTPTELHAQLAVLTELVDGWPQCQAMVVAITAGVERLAGTAST